MPIDICCLFKRSPKTDPFVLVFVRCGPTAPLVFLMAPLMCVWMFTCGVSCFRIDVHERCDVLDSARVEFHGPDS